MSKINKQDLSNKFYSGSFLEEFEAVAVACSSAAAIVENGHKCTSYHELQQRSLEIAGFLKGQGVLNGDLIAIHILTNLLPKKSIVSPVDLKKLKTCYQGSKALSFTQITRLLMLVIR